MERIEIAEVRVLWRMLGVSNAKIKRTPISHMRNWMRRYRSGKLCRVRTEDQGTLILKMFKLGRVEQLSTDEAKFLKKNAIIADDVGPEPTEEQRAKAQHWYQEIVSKEPVQAGQLGGHFTEEEIDAIMAPPSRTAFTEARKRAKKIGYNNDEDTHKLIKDGDWPEELCGTCDGAGCPVCRPGPGPDDGPEYEEIDDFEARKRDLRKVSVDECKVVGTGKGTGAYMVMCGQIPIGNVSTHGEGRWTWETDNGDRSKVYKTRKAAVESLIAAHGWV